ncbi:putative integral membrane protein [Exidia glandulosa HHB12029]|uniref:Putative integral membrane protein n=1 Tax=Exidia glandulosa HHB12029 TaxID=1314781 RepID=A0A165ZNZ9_EXIGL|nr:putative integral membrane protein [Exidia glandulosa HHB12029]
MSRTPSTSTTTARALNVAANVFGAIFVGFGINAILRPAHALTFFEFAPPASAADRQMVDSLMVVYGVRDIFMGLAIHATSYYGSRKALGWIVVAGSGVAFVDGLVCKLNGQGEMNHWGYAPMLTAVGSLLVGGF